MGRGCWRAARCGVRPRLAQQPRALDLRRARRRPVSGGARRGGGHIGCHPPQGPHPRRLSPRDLISRHPQRQHLLPAAPGVAGARALPSSSPRGGGEAAVRNFRPRSGQIAPLPHRRQCRATSGVAAIAAHRAPQIRPPDIRTRPTNRRPFVRLQSSARVGLRLAFARSPPGPAGLTGVICPSLVRS